MVCWYYHLSVEMLLQWIWAYDPKKGFFDFCCFYGFRWYFQHTIICCILIFRIQYTLYLSNLSRPPPQRRCHMSCDIVWLANGLSAVYIAQSWQWSSNLERVWWPTRNQDCPSSVDICWSDILTFAYLQTSAHIHTNAPSSSARGLTGYRILILVLTTAFEHPRAILALRGQSVRQNHWT